MRSFWKKAMVAVVTMPAAFLLMTVLPFTDGVLRAYADEGIIVGDFIVTGGVTPNDYRYSGNILTILSETEITIANRDPETATTQRIVIKEDVNANITLAGVNIASGECAFLIEGDRNIASYTVTITLADDKNNELKSNGGYAGLQKNNTACNLVIQSGKNGTGSLTAKGDYESAGIGGGSGADGTNITIKGGTVTATGGVYGGAGIGGGSGAAGTNITIKGGTVTATGDGGAAGIGGGYGGDGTNITIHGGTVTATGNCGAGIGGGDRGVGTNITINGGTVTATGNGGAGIGGGGSAAGTNITINGGTVTATGNAHSAGIGGGLTGDGTDITINGGTVTATGSNGGDGIGGGYNGSASGIKICGGFCKCNDVM